MSYSGAASGPPSADGAEKASKPCPGAVGGESGACAVKASPPKSTGKATPASLAAGGGAGEALFDGDSGALPGEVAPASTSLLLEDEKSEKSA